MAENDEASAAAGERYRRLAALLPDYFVNPDPDGVVIVKDAEALARAEGEIAARLAAAGQPARWARAGVFYEDAWIWCLRDVVRFPGGGLGTHHRLIHKGGLESVAILPRFEGRLVLLRHFRHGVRGWALEFPRGGGEAGITAEALARNELAEELGAEALSLRPLGLVHPQNNLMATYLRLFFAELDRVGMPNLAEGIAELRLVTVAELERLIDEDVLTDAISLALFTRARLRGLL